MFLDDLEVIQDDFENELRLLKTIQDGFFADLRSTPYLLQQFKEHPMKILYTTSSIKIMLAMSFLVLQIILHVLLSKSPYVFGFV